MLSCRVRARLVYLNDDVTRLPVNATPGPTRAEQRRPFPSSFYHNRAQNRSARSVSLLPTTTTALHNAGALPLISDLWHHPWNAANLRISKIPMLVFDHNRTHRLKISLVLFMFWHERGYIRPPLSPLDKSRRRWAWLKMKCGDHIGHPCTVPSLKPSLSRTYSHAVRSSKHRGEGMFITHDCSLFWPDPARYVLQEWDAEARKSGTWCFSHLIREETHFTAHVGIGLRASLLCSSGRCHGLTLLLVYAQPSLKRGFERHASEPYFSMSKCLWPSSTRSRVQRNSKIITWCRVGL